VQAAAAELLLMGAAVRREILVRITANYRQLLQRAAETPACRVLKSEGGWSAILQVPSLEPEEDLVVDLLQRDGVLAFPGYFFDFPREAYLVVSLLPPEAAFAAGVDAILRHFDCSGETR
jgi:aspartate/methionine/tyrosine aminotransferase